MSDELILPVIAMIVVCSMFAFIGFTVTKDIMEYNFAPTYHINITPDNIMPIEYSSIVHTIDGNKYICDDLLIYDINLNKINIVDVKELHGRMIIIKVYKEEI